MYKYRFFNDYSEGAHSSILELLVKTNSQQQAGYGVDVFSETAKELISFRIGSSHSDIHFISSGTQTNLIMLAAMMKPYESVIACDTGHINVHETGAIEATGHKINVAASSDGKLTVDGIKKVIESHADEHMVKPRVVFISHATELGTIYKKQELEDISKYCRKKKLYLYLDGARLGAGLTSSESDLTLQDVCRYVDAFYIGGTKNGALLGEALVINNDQLKENFRFYLKQRGALLAKGRVLGIQFVGLFTDDLYFDLAKHANAMAAKLTEGIKKLGFNFLTYSNTNQIFPILPDKLIKELQKLYGFYIWKRIDKEHSAIRLVTSWATEEAKVQEFIEDLTKISSL